jgi:hypothetical protein
MGVYPDYSKIHATRVRIVDPNASSDDPNWERIINVDSLERGLELFQSLITSDDNKKISVEVKTPTSSTYDSGTHMMWSKYAAKLYYHIRVNDRIVTLFTYEYKLYREILTRLKSVICRSDTFVNMSDRQVLKKVLFVLNSTDSVREQHDTIIEILSLIKSDKLLHIEDNRIMDLDGNCYVERSWSNTHS